MPLGCSGVHLRGLAMTGCDLAVHDAGVTPGTASDHG
jgi:hypothetical protein